MHILTPYAHAREWMRPNSLRSQIPTKEDADPGRGTSVELDDQRLFAPTTQ
jgi:hypothetical protein